MSDPQGLQKLRSIVATTGLFGLFPLSLSPIMVAAGQGHGFTELEAGIWVTSMLMGVAVSAIALGAMADRVNLRGIIAIGMVIVVATQTALFLLGEVPLTVLCGLSFVSGVGSGCGIVVGDVILARTRNPMTSAGAAMAITSTLMLVVFPAGMWLGQTLGLDAIPILAGGSTAVVLVLLFGVDLEKLRGDDGNRGERRASFGLPAIALVACLLFFWTRDGMIWSFSAIRAEQVGFDPQSIGLLLGVAGACGVFGSALSAWVSYVRSIPPPLLLVAIVPPGVIGGLWTIETSVTNFAALQLLYNAMQLFAYPMLIGFAAQMDRSGRLAAVAGGMTLLGSALGPVVGGFSSDLGGTEGLTSAVMFVSLASLLALALAVQPRQPAARVADPPPRMLG